MSPRLPPAPATVPEPPPGPVRPGGDIVYESLAVTVVADDGIVLDRAVIGR
ncbi:MAG TPA: hypothetical protein VFN05_05320 [Actinomycetes bacterium]|nr:hypothetical protein [Actinomycetes bacterium]